MREFGVIIAAHGRLAAALLDSVQMLCGAQPGVETAALDEKMGLDDMCAAVAAAADRLCAYGALLLLTDLPGGTPDNAALRLACARDDVRLVCGVNMPLLCELALSDGPLSDELVETVVAAGRSGLRDEKDKVARAKRPSAPRETDEL